MFRYISGFSSYDSGAELHLFLATDPDLNWNQRQDQYLGSLQLPV